MNASVCLSKRHILQLPSCGILELWSVCTHLTHNPTASVAAVSTDTAGAVPSGKCNASSGSIATQLTGLKHLELLRVSNVEDHALQQLTALTALEQLKWEEDDFHVCEFVNM
jgi:hypothetical protein